MEKTIQIIESVFHDLKYYGLVTDKVIDQQGYDSPKAIKMTDIYCRANQNLINYFNSTNSNL